MLAALFISATFACKHKDKKSMSEAITAESKAHTDTDRSENTKAVVITADKMISPGIGIGETAINEAGSKVFAQLGKPDFSDAAMGKSVAVWYADHNKKGYSTHTYFSTNMGVDDTSRVKVIRITSPSFKTSNRIYTGVLLADAQKVYQLDSLGTFKLNGSNRKLYDDVTAGIAFDVDRSGNITGITIHETGKSVLNAYMAFFGEVKAIK